MTGNNYSLAACRRTYLNKPRLEEGYVRLFRPSGRTRHLGIDTASPYLALALWSVEKGPLASFCESVGRDHAKRLVPEVEALLERAGVRRDELGGVGGGAGAGLVHGAARRGGGRPGVWLEA